MSLVDVLTGVRERVSRHRGSRIGEQNTKATLIVPVLRALGWDVENLEEVHLEYRRRPTDKPVDYALLLQRNPSLFVEAKALDESLDDQKWASQIIGYAVVAGVEWVVLTNGDEYRIYNTHALVPVEDKLFRTVRLSEDITEAADALGLLSKEETREKALTALWTAHSIDRRVREAVNSLFAPEPSPWLIRRLARELGGLSQGDIRAALNRARIHLDFPHVELTGKPFVDPPDPPPGLTVIGVSVKDLIDADLVRPPLELAKTYLGSKLSATIEADGRVRCLGEIYSSLSTAAGMARASVKGAPSGRKFPQTNGWMFWQFRDEDGQTRELSVLRERFLKERGSTAHP